jgi:hypothetical protein
MAMNSGLGRVSPEYESLKVSCERENVKATVKEERQWIAGAVSILARERISNRCGSLASVLG